ncbi:hypothetical protein KJ942_07245 [bacterium]|nr:hypothetical protein [bacterium]MBU4024113.1 hypothetical protein [bacterium]
MALISLSGTLLLFGLFLEYLKERHINRIKNMISQSNSEAVELLRVKKRVQSISLLHKIEAIMLLAGFHFSVYAFIGIFVLFTTFIGFLFALFVQHWTGYLIGIPFGILIFYTIFQSRILNRKKEFNRAFAIAISVLVKMMKTGVGFEQAMSRSIAVSNSQMFKDIFDGFFKEKNTIGEEEAFANLTKQINSKELRIFALAVKIGRASGGRFSNTLEKVEQTLLFRKRMQDKVDVVTREGAFGSYVVAGIAIFLYFALDGNFDGKLNHYYMNSEYGRFQLLGIFLWIFFGLIVNKALTRIKQ